jgi:hypothetical protein
MLPDIPKLFLDAAKLSIDLAGQLRNADRQRRTDIADLFDRIGDCLAAVSSEIRLGNIPHGKCGELLGYAQVLPQRLQGTVADAQARQLGHTLTMAYNVEQMAMQLGRVVNVEPELGKIEEASGKFKALSNMVRAGL